MERDFNPYGIRSLPREALIPLVRDRADMELAVFACYSYNDRDGLFSTYDMLWRTQPIPTDRDRHFFGYLTTARIHFVRGTTEGVEPPPREKYESHSVHQDVPKPVTFHSQPLRSHYSDIPPDEDLLRFLKFRHLRHVLIGRRYVSIFEKNKQTNQLILDLWDWEQSHPYRMSRLLKKYPESEARRRYASSALRGIGLHWPYHIAVKRREWPRILRDLGIVVTMTDRKESGVMMRELRR